MYLKVEEKKFSELIDSNKFLHNAIFEIPAYQRAYSRDKEQWEDLFEDVLQANKKGLSTDFLGSILINNYTDENEKKRYRVVDGQQRLVTLLLFYSCLTQEKRDFIPIDFNDEREDDIFERLWENKCIVKKDHIFQDFEQSNRLYQAKLYFQNKLEESKIGKKKIKNLLENLTLSLVLIDDSFESNLLFGRLNARGLQLSEVDFIKYKMFYSLDKQFSSGRKYDTPLRKWQTIQENLQKLNLTIERFFPLYLKIRGLRDSISEDNLANNFLGNPKYEMSAIKSEKEYSTFLNDLGKDAKRLAKLREIDSNKPAISENLKWFLKFSTDEAKVGLFKVLLTVDDKGKSTYRKQFNKIIEIFALTEFTRFLFNLTINDENLNKLDAYFLNFSSDVVSDFIKELKQRIKASFPSKAEFIRQFSKLRNAKGSDIKFEQKENEIMLTQYALSVLSAKAENREVIDSNYNIEHILRKSDAHAAGAVEFRIGNLMMLEKQLNSEAGDKLIDEKLSIYARSHSEQVREFLNRSKRSKKWVVNPENPWRPFMLEKEYGMTFPTTFPMSYSQEFIKNENWVVARGKKLAEDFYKLILEKLD